MGEARPLAHVSKEVFKTLPSLAYLDAATAVDFVFDIFRI
jgi:hypothetical protein